METPGAGHAPLLLITPLLNTMINSAFVAVTFRASIIS